MWRGRSRAAAGGVAGALVLGATVALLLGSQGRARSWTTVLFAWKPYEAPHNVFDDFDEFKAPKWRDYTAPSNVFDELPELAEADHKWEANVLNDENVMDDIPEDRYPFNPTAGGHEWKKWDEGDSAAEQIKEMNVFDHGQGLAAVQLGEHTVTDSAGEGRPFKCNEEDRAEGGEEDGGSSPCTETNVFDNLVDPELSEHPIDTKEGTPEWGKTVASLDKDVNVFDTEQFPDS